MTDLSHEDLDGEESLQEMVELVFKRAVQKPDSAAVFAELCQHPSTVEFQSLSDWSASVSFRSLLVKHCQAEFRKNMDKEGIYQESGSCLKPVQDVRIIERLREEQQNAKPSGRFLNMLRFYWGAVPLQGAGSESHALLPQEAVAERRGAVS